MTTADRKALRKLAEAATPGPRKAAVDLFDIDDEIVAVVDGAGDMLFRCGTGVEPYRGPEDPDGWTAVDSVKRDARWKQAHATQAMADATFIAAANPTAVLSLLDEVERLERELADQRTIAEVATTAAERRGTQRDVAIARAEKAEATVAQLRDMLDVRHGYEASVVIGSYCAENTALRERAEKAEAELAELRRHNAERVEMTERRGAWRDKEEP